MHDFRKKTMLRAHAIHRQEGGKFGDGKLGECIARAWEIYRTLKRMKTEEVSFTYEKKDGTTREARGMFTVEAIDSIKGTKEFTPESTSYYDLDKKAWRGFQTSKFKKAA